MFKTHQLPSSDLWTNYDQVTKFVSDHNDVAIINNGEADAILINPKDWNEFNQYRYTRYVKNKLKEVENVANDPSTWMSENEFWNIVNKNNEMYN